jgi:hypothetical protein
MSALTGFSRIFPVCSSAAPRKQQAGELGLKERW